jgi:hypothetical protein
MMNTVIIISNDYSLLNSGIGDDSIIISFVIDSIESVEKLNLTAIHHALLLKNKNVYFLFHFNLSDNNTKSFIQAMDKQTGIFMQFFFHPKYYCVEDKPAISVEGERGATQEIKEVISNLRRQAVEQGFSDLHPIYFTGTGYIHNEEMNILYGENEALNNFSTAYYELLSRHYYVSKYIGVRSMIDKGFTKALAATEAKISENEPVLFNHLLKFCQLKKAVVQLRNDIGAANEDLINQKAYLKILKDQDEAIKINEFYHNEYEVLPLWYKQFGHLIKAVMGKRTWGSLFNDNVKKYKN